MANAFQIESTSEIDVDTAIQLLKNYIEAAGKSQATVAKELGVSTGQVSGFLKGTYSAPHTLIPKIIQLVKISQERQAVPREPEFKMTSISRHVTNIITYCHLQGKIGVAYGDPGIGKTMSVREYIKRNPEAIMVTVSPCFATISGVNDLLTEELKIREKTARRAYMEIVNKLKGSNRVIIIDEAQHLTVRAINHLRSITDESGVGIAFVGNEEIYLKMKGTGQAAYAQLFSRIGNRAHLSTSQIKKEDVRMVFEEAALADEAIDILYGISRTNYGLRGAVNVYVNTIIGFKVSDYQDLTAARISRMAKEMNIA